MSRQLTQAFSLLENMIALAIVSIGLLGSAGLFSEALSQQRSNTQRRAAVMLGEELIDVLIAARRSDSTDIADTGSSNCAIARERCFNDSRLEALLTRWHRRLRQALPDAHCELTRLAGATTTSYAIDIEWRDRSGESRSQRFEFLLHS